MKIFVSFLIFIFVFKSWAIADDIRDFEMEGISVGDNLLDHYNTLGVTKKFIEDKKLTYYPKSKKFALTAYKNRGNYKTYYKLQFTIDPTNYEIYKVGGFLEISGKNDCIAKQKKIINDLIETDESLTKFIDDFSKHPADDTGKSISNGVYLDFPSGDSIDVECYLWGDKLKKEGYEDNLRINLSTKRITNFLRNEAY
tara:strand:- start:836 stop:1429 length:594 start_codon:yes stop_codon:yes gene_type:complete